VKDDGEGMFTCSWAIAWIKGHWLRTRRRRSIISPSIHESWPLAPYFLLPCSTLWYAGVVNRPDAKSPCGIMPKCAEGCAQSQVRSREKGPRDWDCRDASTFVTFIIIDYSFHYQYCSTSFARLVTDGYLRVLAKDGQGVLPNMYVSLDSPTSSNIIALFEDVTIAIFFCQSIVLTVVLLAMLWEIVPLSKIMTCPPPHK